MGAFAWGLAALALGGAGCATPGVLHVYALPTPTAADIHDRGPQGNGDVPSFLEPGERVNGFAYDPFTDHFFLRFDGSATIRVVDRPARAVKRTFTVAGLDATGGDLAIRPRDGHVFFLQANQASVFETTRLGKPVRTFPLSGGHRLVGLALDLLENRLLASHADGRTLTWYDLDGRPLGTLTLAQPIRPSLGFDSEQREIYAPLAEARGAVGVFDVSGRHLRTLETTVGTFVDVGPRSFIRVF